MVLGYVTCAGDFAVPADGWCGRVPVLPLHAGVRGQLPSPQQEVGLPLLPGLCQVLQT